VRAAQGPRPVAAEGPVRFTKTAELDGEGRYTYHSGYEGHLTITPMDVTQSPPVPAGPPFKGVVNGTQEGLTRAGFSQVSAIDRRVAPQSGGAELLMTRLKVGTEGRNSYRAQSACLTD